VSKYFIDESYQEKVKRSARLHQITNRDKVSKFLSYRGLKYYDLKILELAVFKTFPLTRASASLRYICLFHKTPRNIPS